MVCQTFQVKPSRCPAIALKDWFHGTYRGSWQEGPLPSSSSRFDLADESCELANILLTDFAHGLLSAIKDSCLADFRCSVGSGTEDGSCCSFVVHFSSADIAEGSHPPKDGPSWEQWQATWHVCFRPWLAQVWQQFRARSSTLDPFTEFQLGLRH